MTFVVLEVGGWEPRTLGILYEQGIRSKLSGDAVYHPFFILQVKDMLCSKPHCHKVLIELPFHIKLTCVRAHPNGDDITLQSN